jgi:NAD(P)H dehydrogenase (quinone)
MQATSHLPKILIVYYSRFGVLKLLAERIAEGARQAMTAEASILAVEDQPLEELRPGEDEQAMTLRRAAVVGQLATADALIVGAPSYFGSMASPLKRLFEDCVTADGIISPDKSRPWRHYLFRNKVGAAFTSSATPHGGNEQTLQSILTMLMHLGMIVVTPGQCEPILENESAPYGATAITGAEGNRLPTDLEQAMARALGEQVAEVTTWLHWGRMEADRRRPQLLTVSSPPDGVLLPLDGRPARTPVARAPRPNHYDPST